MYYNMCVDRWKNYIDVLCLMVPVPVPGTVLVYSVLHIYDCCNSFVHVCFLNNIREMSLAEDD